MGEFNNPVGCGLIVLLVLSGVMWAFLVLCDWARALDRQDRVKKFPASEEALTGKKDDVRVGQTSNTEIIARSAEKSKGVA